MKKMIKWIFAGLSFAIGVLAADRAYTAYRRWQVTGSPKKRSWTDPKRSDEDTVVRGFTVETMES